MGCTVLTTAPRHGGASSVLLGYKKNKVMKRAVTGSAGGNAAAKGRSGHAKFKSAAPKEVPEMPHRGVRRAV